MGWRDDITASKVLKARHINEASRELSYWVNGQLTSYDSKTSDYESTTDEPFAKKGEFTSREVFKPDFFGSPSPRMVADSGLCIYRDTDQDWSKGAVFNSNSTGSGSSAIPGLSGSIRLRERSLVNIMASFYCFELGGVGYVQEQLADVGSNSFLNHESYGLESKLAGRAFLQVDGATKFATARPVHVGMVGSRSSLPKTLEKLDSRNRHGMYVNKGELLIPMINRKVQNIHFQTELNAGIHHIGVIFEGAQKMNEPSYPAVNYWYGDEDGYLEVFGHPIEEQVKLTRHKNVFFLSRNFIVDAYAIEDRYQSSLS